MSASDPLQAYENLVEIGSGTHGTVYRARMRSSPQQQVALKKVAFGGRIEDGVPTSVIREVSLLRALGPHDNVVRLLDVKMGDKSIYMVFELMERDLRALLKALPPGKSLDAQTVRSYSQQLLSGLAWCHGHGVIHRDLKPHNLLVDSSGRLKLADWGMARAFSRFERAYTPIVVTLWYRSPELLMGLEQYGPPLDMWSVGCIIMEMITRRAPFTGDSEIAQLMAIFRLKGTPTEETWPGISTLPHYQYKFSSYPGNTSWLTVHTSRVGVEGINMIGALLEYVPTNRLTAAAALQHPYFFD